MVTALESDDRRCNPCQGAQIYDKHTQANAIDFVDHIIEKFPFRIKEIKTDNGHEFQAKFHWHVEDQIGGVGVSQRIRAPSTSKSNSRDGSSVSPTCSPTGGNVRPRISTVSRFPAWVSA